MNHPIAPNTAHVPLPRAAQAVLLVGAAGFFFANFTVQLLAARSGMGNLGAWTLPVYTLSSLVGAMFAQPLEQLVGTRRYFVGAAVLLAAFGAVQAAVPSTTALLAMRSFEGFASGGFGPRALMAAFLLYRGERVTGMLALGAFFLALAGAAACVMLGLSDALLGRHGVFLLQCTLGLFMAVAGLRWLPRARHTAVANASTRHVPSSRSAAVSRRRRRGIRKMRATAAWMH